MSKHRVPPAVLAIPVALWLPVAAALAQEPTAHSQPAEDTHTAAGTIGALFGQLTPVATPYLGNIATGPSITNNVGGARLYSQGRYPIRIHQPIPAGSTVVLDNSCAWLIAAASNEEHITTTGQYNAVGLEDPLSGTIYQATFGGSATGSCANASNGVLSTDPIAVTTAIPAETVLFYKTNYQDLTNGVLLRGGGAPVDMGAAFEYSSSPLGTNRAGIPGPFASTGIFTAYSANAHPPLALKAMTTMRSFLGVGTSRMQGYVDNYEGDVGVGNVARSFDAMKVPFINTGLGSDQMAYFNASHAVRSQLDNAVSDVILEEGTNDIAAGASLATLISLTTTARRFFSPAHKVHIPTIEPRSTLAAQTIGTLTPNGNGIALTGLSTTNGLAPGEIITITGSVPSTNNGRCLITEVVSATALTCLSATATGTAPATTAGTFTDGGGSPGFQTADANLAVLTGYNRWRRAQVQTPSVAGYWSAPEVADFVSSGPDSGRWRALPCVPSLSVSGASSWYSGPNGAISYDGVHENHCGYTLLGRSGVYSPATLN